MENIKMLLPGLAKAPDISSMFGLSNQRAQEISTMVDRALMRAKPLIITNRDKIEVAMGAVKDLPLNEIAYVLYQSGVADGIIVAKQHDPLYTIAQMLRGM